MTYTEMINLLESAGEDVTFYTGIDYEMKEAVKTIEITFEDFEGFEDDWNEIEREYDNPELVESIINFIEEKNDWNFNDWYYFFEDETCETCFKVYISFASEDI